MRRRRCEVGMLLLALTVVAATLAAQQEAPLDNAQILRLSKLEMGDSVVVAKIRAAKEVRFATSTDDLVKLKEAGVSEAVLVAMLERVGPTAAASPKAPEGDPAGKVTLRSRDGLIDLKAVYGNATTQVAPFSVVTWVEFVGLSAPTRIRDRRPTVLIATGNPRGRWWFVRTSQQKDEDYRYFDLDGGGAFSMSWSGSPEKGSIVKCEMIEEKPGLWALTPLKDLKPGEYGVFAGQVGPFAPQGQAVLFGFGVDK